MDKYILPVTYILLFTFIAIVIIGVIKLTVEILKNKINLEDVYENIVNSRKKRLKITPRKESNEQ